MNINTSSQPGLTQPAASPFQNHTGRTVGTPHPFSTLLRNVQGPLTRNVNNHLQTQADSLAARAQANRSQ